MTGTIGESQMIYFTGKFVVATILLLIFVIVFVFCLHFYATCCWYRHMENTSAAATIRRRRRRRRRFDFAAGHQEITLVSPLRRGLDPSILKAIPILVFDPEVLKDGLECAVCLCEVSQGEKARILPKCNHGFHVDCIDMWFQSHSTCPLCRNPVSDHPISVPDKTLLQAPDPVGDNSPSGVNLLSREAPNFPTNVLIWGNEAQVSTFGPCVEDSLHQGNNTITIAESSSTAIGSSDTGPHNGISVTVLDIPRQINQEEEQKSSVPTRLRSLKRLLSGNHRRVNPSSPRNLDLEQGGGAQD